MPNNWQHSASPELEIEVVDSFGDTDDATYIKLTNMCLRVLKDVHLFHGSDMQMSTGHLEHKEEPLSMLLLVIHGMEVIEGDFEDAMTALLIQRAPLVSWTIDTHFERITIVGKYNNDMPIESIT